MIEKKGEEEGDDDLNNKKKIKIKKSDSNQTKMTENIKNEKISEENRKLTGWTDEDFEKFKNSNIFKSYSSENDNEDNEDNED